MNFLIGPCFLFVVPLLLRGWIVPVGGSTPDRHKPTGIDRHRPAQTGTEILIPEETLRNSENKNSRPGRQGDIPAKAEIYQGRRRHSNHTSPQVCRRQVGAARVRHHPHNQRHQQCVGNARRQAKAGAARCHPPRPNHARRAPRVCGKRRKQNQNRYLAHLSSPNSQPRIITQANAAPPPATPATIKPQPGKKCSDGK